MGFIFLIRLIIGIDVTGWRHWHWSEYLIRASSINYYIIAWRRHTWLVTDILTGEYREPWATPSWAVRDNTRITQIIPSMLFTSCHTALPGRYALMKLESPQHRKEYTERLPSILNISLYRRFEVEIDIVVVWLPANDNARGKIIGEHLASFLRKHSATLSYHDEDACSCCYAFFHLYCIKHLFAIILRRCRAFTIER